MGWQFLTWLLELVLLGPERMKLQSRHPHTPLMNAVDDTMCLPTLLKYSISMLTTLKHPKLFSCWFNLQRSQDALCHFCEYKADISSQFLAHWWLMSMFFLLCQVQSHGLEVKLDSCCLVPSCSYIESGTENDQGVLLMVLACLKSWQIFHNGAE